MNRPPVPEQRLTDILQANGAGRSESTEGGHILSGEETRERIAARQAARKAEGSIPKPPTQ